MMQVSVVFDAIHTLWNQIMHAILNLRIFDILDILIIAYIIYKAIGFLKETRAGQLVKGIAVVLIMYIIADVFKLAVLRWLLSAIVGSAIVAFAIIFQPELRRILERVGQVKLGYSQSGDGEQARMLDAIDKICKAAGNMQQNKVGALIVFERKTQLGEIINTGTLIDSQVSTAMVNNIFFPKSPLHDGAVIVRDGRIYAAGCILPLTQSTAFSSQLGTRHRAAIGMTENSDAVVLIVSEETGIISIAHNGEIKRNYNVTSAYTELKDMLVDREVAEKESTLVSAAKRIFALAKSKSKTKDKEEETNEN